MKSLAEELNLLPIPRELRKLEGAVILHEDTAPTHQAIRPDEVNQPEGYRLRIEADRVSLVAHDEAGLFYGLATLRQMPIGRECPAVEIEDWPALAVRGVHWDISRNRVPTMDTLFMMIDRLASWKVNVLQLYIEHTFAYPSHPQVWKGYSPLTPEQVQQLDGYCRDRHMELIPAQASFGHMHHWLKHDHYRPLAECPDGWSTAFNPNPGEPFTLCPLDPGSLGLVESIYDELLPHFSSRRVHAGFDETFELGEGRSAELCQQNGVGRVYLDFLRRVCEVIRDRQREMIVFGDVLVRHPDLLRDLPDGITVQHWGYDAAYPFDQELPVFVDAGVPVWVCSSTSNYCSLTGRTHRAIQNIKNAAIAAVKFGAQGLMNTEWGDHGNWHSLTTSWLGLAYGAAMAWSPQDNEELDVADALNKHVFQDDADVMGHLLYDAGNVYRITNPDSFDVIPFYVLQQASSSRKRRRDQMTSLALPALEESRAVLAELRSRLPDAAMRCQDASTVQGELELGIDLFDHACEIAAFARHRGLSKIHEAARQMPESIVRRQRDLMRRQREVWLLRSRPGGLDESLRWYDPAWLKMHDAVPQPA